MYHSSDIAYIFKLDIIKVAIHFENLTTYNDKHRCTRDISPAGFWPALLRD